MATETDAPASSFVGFISAWKAIVVTVVICLVALTPFLPGVASRTTYTSFFYSREGYPFLVASSAFSLLIAAATIPLIFRALLSRPAIEITSDTVRIWGIKWRAYPLNGASRVSKVVGSLLIRNPDGKQFTIPLWVYRDPKGVLAHLQAGGLRVR